MSHSRLQKELKIRQPFDSVEQEANLNILRTSDLLQNRFGRFLREYGLTSSQFNVLRILQNEGHALPSLEIGERMVQEVPAITGLIDRLEKHGLVVRKRCQQDRRIVYVELTPAGNELIQQIYNPLLELHKRLSGALSQSELKELTRLMEKMRAGIEDHEQ